MEPLPVQNSLESKRNTIECPFFFLKIFSMKKEFAKFTRSVYNYRSFLKGSALCKSFLHSKTLKTARKTARWFAAEGDCTLFVSPILALKHVRAVVKNEGNKHPRFF